MDTNKDNAWSTKRRSDVEAGFNEYVTTVWVSPKDAEPLGPEYVESSA